MFTLHTEVSLSLDDGQLLCIGVTTYHFVSFTGTAGYVGELTT